MGTAKTLNFSKSKGYTFVKYCSIYYNNKAKLIIILNLYIKFHLYVQHLLRKGMETVYNWNDSKFNVHNSVENLLNVPKIEQN